MEKRLVRCWCSQESLLPQSSSRWGTCPWCSMDRAVPSCAGGAAPPGHKGWAARGKAAERGATGPLVLSAGSASCSNTKGSHRGTGTAMGWQLVELGPRPSPSVVVHQAERWDTKRANDRTLEESACTETFPLSLHFVIYQGTEAKAENVRGSKLLRISVVGWGKSAPSYASERS